MHFNVLPQKKCYPQDSIYISGTLISDGIIQLPIFGIWNDENSRHKLFPIFFIF
jgi:hypothetical protein